MNHKKELICIPGERLCSREECVPGSGTYTRHGYVYSSLAGYKQTKEQINDLSIVEVVRREKQNVVPKEGSLVFAKVTACFSLYCKCAIVSVEDTPLSETFRAMIRKEDVRATEKDKVEIYKCFRPGDIVKARVLSLGDALSYLLTTAENELGVILAQSEAGANMIPLSWCEMICPKSHVKENRKVAKIKLEALVQR